MVCAVPDDVEELLPDCEDGEVLPLLQKGLLLGKLTASLILILHVVRKLLLRPTVGKNG